MQTAALPVFVDQRQEIIDFMTGFSLETTPGSAAKIASFRNHLKAGCNVYITYLPGSDFKDTITVAARLRREGFNPVPHFAARSIPGKNFLEESLQRLRDEANVSQVLLIGGGVTTPVGEFSDSMQLLATGLLDKYRIRKIGIAGHPEGSLDISEQAIKQALKWKTDFATRTNAEMYLVTQFCFESDPIIKWDQRIQAEGNRLPIHIGIPGLATVKTLMAHARTCGIGPSVRFIRRQAMNVAKVLTVAAPDKLVTALAAYKAADSNCGIQSVHMFPLGGLKKTADWAYAVVDGQFELSTEGTGFRVTTSS